MAADYGDTQRRCKTERLRKEVGDIRESRLGI
jgi:hypothetical protein